MLFIFIRKCHVMPTNKCYATLKEIHIIPIITCHVMSFKKWQLYLKRFELMFVILKHRQVQKSKMNWNSQIKIENNWMETKCKTVWQAKKRATSNFMKVQLQRPMFQIKCSNITFNFTLQSINEKSGFKHQKHKKVHIYKKRVWQ